MLFNGAEIFLYTSPLTIIVPERNRVNKTIYINLLRVNSEVCIHRLTITMRDIFFLSLTARERKHTEKESLEKGDYKL